MQSIAAVSDALKASPKGSTDLAKRSIVVRILDVSRTPFCFPKMVGVKAAPRGLVMVHAPPAAEESHLDLPLVDCRISDDFEELADCQLICGNEIIKCHSQVANRPRQGFVMGTVSPAAVITRSHEPQCLCCIRQTYSRELKYTIQLFLTC